MDISIVMNIITFWAHTRFNSIFPVVKIISERFSRRGGGEAREGWMDGWMDGWAAVLKEARKVDTFARGWL